MEPWGTPQQTGVKEEESSPVDTEKDLKHNKTVTLKPGRVQVLTKEYRDRLCQRQQNNLSQHYSQLTHPLM